MLDIGWSEMAIIAVVALFVIGPRELPRMLRAIGHYAAKIRGLAREFQQGIDEAVRESELDEVKKQIESAQKLDVGKAIQNTVDPERRIDRAMDFSGAEAAARPNAAQPAPAATEDAPGAAAQPAAGDSAQGAAAAQGPAGAAQPETSEAAGAEAEPEREAAPAPPRAAPRRAQGMASMAAAAAAPRKAAAPPAETETTGAGA